MEKTLNDFLNCDKNKTVKVQLTRKNSAGEDCSLIFELRMPDIKEYDEFNINFNSKILYSEPELLTICMVSPNLYDKDLQDKFNAKTPIDLLTKMLNLSEYQTLSTALANLILPKPKKDVSTDDGKEDIKKK